ncbi:MAG: energy-coupling factor ABC transporter permease [Thermoleophilaceae bacterium]
MHVPDGFLTGEAAAAGWVAGGAGLAYCLHRTRAERRERDLPVAGLAAAFFLVGDAPVFPVTVGTQGHLLGGMLACALLGPWLGAVTIAVVSAIQALALGDGGITTLGLGIVNLALVPAFLGYPLLLALRRIRPTPGGLAVAAGVCAWLSVVVAACLFSAEFAFGHQVAIDPGRVTAGVVGAYALIGILEGVLTALILRALLGVRPDLVRAGNRIHRERMRAASAGVGAGAS